MSKVHRKFPMKALGGLLLTCEDESVAEDTASAILWLLQHKPCPEVEFGRIHDNILKLSRASPSESNGAHHSPLCVIPLCVRIALLSNSSLPQNTATVEEILDCDEARACYEPWEVRFMESTMARARFDFVRCSELTREGLTLEPRDAFSAYLLFITSFNSGRWINMAEGFAAAIPRVGDPLVETSALPIFLPKPYYLALFGFAANEAKIGSWPASLHYVMTSVDQVKALNAQHVPADENESEEESASARPFIHPFAVHAICHLFGESPREGLRYLNEALPRWMWDTTSSFVCHLFYHVATLYLDANLPLEALRVYDEDLWPRANSAEMSTLGESSGVLNRFEMAGILANNDPRAERLTDKWVVAGFELYRYNGQRPLFGDEFCGNCGPLWHRQRKLEVRSHCHCRGMCFQARRPGPSRRSECCSATRS